MFQIRGADHYRAIPSILVVVVGCVAGSHSRYEDASELELGSARKAETEITQNPKGTPSVMKACRAVCWPLWDKTWAPLTERPSPELQNTVRALRGFGVQGIAIQAHHSNSQGYPSPAQ